MNVNYLIWVLHFYDIEESSFPDNCHCLSLKYAEEQGAHIHGRFIYTKEDILRNVWDKDDVNEFIKENPEALSWTFLIYKNNYRWKKGEKNYCEYSQLIENREKNVLSILS